ncbi:mitochondrial mRNA pseudouridine synthase RPUSD3 isoform X1 [Pogona vitticeps]
MAAPSFCARAFEWNSLLLSRSLVMFRSGPWPLVRGRLRAPLSTLAWYQMVLKGKGLGKPVTEDFSRVSILEPGKPRSREELLKLLETSVIHRDDSFVAINKPPGLPVAGRPEELTLLSLLPDLSQKLDLPRDLQVIRAAGKESSGLVLLSSCQSTIRDAHNFYIQSRSAKQPTATYYAICTRIPAALEGNICTFLKMMQVEGFNLVVPVASPSHRSIKRKEVKNTLTRYKVLDSREGCALLQLQPMTVFSSQLLVHLTLIFSPVLGDHVYSARVGTVLGQPFLLPAESTLPRTQILEESLLNRLCVQQRHVHRLPLHLHLHQLLLPAAGSSSSNPVLTAPPPPFFLKTLHLLGLTFPQETNKP